MAITTENEKLSMISLMQPWNPTLPRPTGASFDQGDMQHLIWCFSSTEWGELSSSDPVVLYSLIKDTLSVESLYDANVILLSRIPGTMNLESIHLS